jgi:SAM-dependent methyltransferase
VSFVHGDAQVYPFEPEAHDVAISSFGAMFFSDPVAAFTNIGRTVRPGGRLALLAWRSLPENEWLMAFRDALAVGRELPMPPPEAPTPFSLADPERVSRVLGAAGFDDVAFTPIDEPMLLGSDAADAMVFASSMGIVEGLTHGLDDDTRATAMANLTRLFAERETPDGVLIGSASWTITATKRH